MLLRYLAQRLLHREPGAARYLRMGLGIERRARELAAFWGPHQERTRSAQTRWAGSAHGGTLTVLGAGRLLDFAADSLAPRFEQLRLVDADRSCESSWRGLGKPVEPVFTDISGCIDRWAASLGMLRGSWQETLDAIRKYGVEPEPAYSASSDAVLSLNLISQLPIGWQDGVEAFLWKRFGRGFVERREQEWLDAVRPGARMLVEQHLAALARSGARSVLLIGDLEYVEYSGRKYSRRRWEPEPVRYEGAEWLADAGVKCEVSPALDPVNLEGAAFAEWMPSYRVAWQESWLWHIAPMGAECPHCGTIHRVGAFALQR
ncbi:MAG: hypothetical protein U0Q16_12190 [Bryobacteraceae bacterium]